MELLADGILALGLGLVVMGIWNVLLVRRGYVSFTHITLNRFLLWTMAGFLGSVLVQSPRVFLTALSIAVGMGLAMGIACWVFQQERVLRKLLPPLSRS